MESYKSNRRGRYESSDGILHYSSEEDPEVSDIKELPRIKWRVKQDGKWMPENEPGIQGYPIQAIAIDFEGNGWYEACTFKHNWLGSVDRYDIANDKDGYAGREDSPIIAVRCLYDSVNDDGAYFLARYRVSNINKDWQPYCYSRGIAGEMKPIDRFEIEIVETTRDSDPA